MNEGGKSDSFIVAEKPANKGWGAPQSAEWVEPRKLTERNPRWQDRCRTQRRMKE